MSCREHMKAIFDAPRVYTEQLSMDGGDVFMSQVPEIKDFRTYVLHVKLPPDEDADETNMPTALKAWAVEGADPTESSAEIDAEGTRVLVHEKCLDDLTNWSGYMFLEVSETHIAQYLGQSESGDYPNIQFSVAGPNGVDYDVTVVMMEPRNKEPGIILEDNS